MNCGKTRRNLKEGSLTYTLKVSVILAVKRPGDRTQLEQFYGLHSRKTVP